MIAANVKESESAVLPIQDGGICQILTLSHQLSHQLPPWAPLPLAAFSGFRRFRRFTSLRRFGGIFPVGLSVDFGVCGGCLRSLGVFCVRGLARDVSQNFPGSQTLRAGRGVAAGGCVDRVRLSPGERLERRRSSARRPSDQLERPRSLKSGVALPP